VTAHVATQTALDDEERAFLAQARRAHLATVSGDGMPHVIPICFAVLDPATVVFAVDDKPKAAGRTLTRLRNLTQNPRFALVVDHWDEDWGRLGYVLVRGRGVLLRDAARRIAAVAALRDRYPQYVAMDLDPARHEVVELAIERVHRWGRLKG
jgi:PPOX class probable F420-dependent enzyme